MSRKPGTKRRGLTRWVFPRLQTAKLVGWEAGMLGCRDAARLFTLCALRQIRCEVPGKSKKSKSPGRGTGEVPGVWTVVIYCQPGQHSRRTRKCNLSGSVPTAEFACRALTSDNASVWHRKMWKLKWGEHMRPSGDPLIHHGDTRLGSILSYWYSIHSLEVPR